MLGAQIRKSAIFTLLILTVVLAVDYLLSGVIFVTPGVPYTPFMTIAITLLVAPAATFYLIRQAARVEAFQASLAAERTAASARASCTLPPRTQSAFR